MDKNSEKLDHLAKWGNKKESTIDNRNAPFYHSGNYRNFFECYNGKKKERERTRDTFRNFLVDCLLLDLFFAISEEILKCLEGHRSYG